MNSMRYRQMMNNHNDMVQAVPAMPADNMAWSGSNSIGNVVDYMPDSNNEQMILKLDEWGPPDMWTISLGIDRPGTNFQVVDNTFEVTAKITFGSGGATQQIFVDWVAGTQLSVPMNSCNVTAQYNFQVIPGFPAACEDLRLSVMIARGTCANKYSPVKTIVVPARIVSASSYTFELPPFTQEIEVLRYLNDASDPFSGWPAGSYFILGDGYIDFDQPLTTQSRYIAVVAAMDAGFRTRLPGGSRAIELFRNASPATFSRLLINCYLGA